MAPVMAVGDACVSSESVTGAKGVVASIPAAQATQVAVSGSTVRKATFCSSTLAA